MKTSIAILIGLGTGLVMLIFEGTRIIGTFIIGGIGIFAIIAIIVGYVRERRG